MVHLLNGCVYLIYYYVRDMRNPIFDHSSISHWYRIAFPQLSYTPDRFSIKLENTTTSTDVCSPNGKVSMQSTPYSFRLLLLSLCDSTCMMPNWCWLFRFHTSKCLRLAVLMYGGEGAIVLLYMVRLTIVYGEVDYCIWWGWLLYMWWGWVGVTFWFKSSGGGGLIYGVRVFFWMWGVLLLSLTFWVKHGGEG